MKQFHQPAVGGTPTAGKKLLALRLLVMGRNNSGRKQMDPLDNLPRIFRVVKDFIELKNRDLSKLIYSDLKSEWDDKIKRYPYLFYNNSNSDNLFHVFRATRINDPDIITLRDLSYPLPDKCKRQRCNWKEHPVLYTCEFPRTTLFECQARKGDSFYITSWRINNMSKIRSIPFLYNYHGNSPVLLKQRDKILQDLKDYHEKHNTPFEEERFEEEKIMMSLIEDVFQDSSHFISSFLSHFYLYKYPCESETHKKPNTIIYPSIKSDKNDVNWAFHPSLLEEKIIELDHIISCKVTNVDIDNIDIDLTYALGTIQENKLIWVETSETFLRSSEFKALF